MTPKQRRQIYEKYDGHCAYCGKEITMKDMQVDHIQSRYNGGDNDIGNYNPSCRACNFRKGANSVEIFRSEIQKQCDRLLSTFSGRMSIAYGLIEKVGKPIKFYFETYNKERYDSKRTDSRPLQIRRRLGDKGKSCNI